ncbi:MAG: hypothetical protein JRH15_00730 [Deltaproteobacteria bacterium]|nr:hypothetical protein [Deltaproteobacteria bacterium]
MKPSFIKNLIEGDKRKLVFMGESGCGKSEMALNFALSIVKETQRTVHFFDMDQSKPMLRSRDVKGMMKDKGIRFHSGEKFLDAPIVPHGVETILDDDRNLAILDVGGNATGAINIGQYADHLNDRDTAAYFIVNYYRAFSGKQVQVAQTIDSIKRASGIKRIQIISNPFAGMDASSKDIAYGHEKTSEMLANIGYPVQILAVPETICNGGFNGSAKYIIRIRPYMRLI